MISYSELHRTIERPIGRHEALRRRAEFLEPPERELLELAIFQKATCRQVAALIGVAPGTASRRAWRLTDRLYDPIVVRLMERPEGLRPEQRAVGLDYFLHRKPIRRIMEIHDLSKAEVQAIIEYLRLWNKS